MNRRKLPETVPAPCIPPKDRVYENVLENTGLSAVFSGAALKLSEVPVYAFTVKAGFAGTVTVATANGNYTFEITASEKATKIFVLGMKAYELAETVTVTANGAFGEEAVAVEGQFNLATYANYHSVNAEINEASRDALDLVNALYDYVNAAAKFNAGTLAQPEVETPDPEIPAPETGDAE